MSVPSPASRPPKSLALERYRRRRRPALQGRGGGAVVERVVAGSADDGEPRGGSGQSLAAIGKPAQGFDIRGRQCEGGKRGAHLVIARRNRLQDRIAGIVDDEDIVAQAARHRVGAALAVEQVVAAAAGEGVRSETAGQSVGAETSEDREASVMFCEAVEAEAFIGSERGRIDGKQPAGRDVRLDTGQDVIVRGQARPAIKRAGSGKQLKSLDSDERIGPEGQAGGIIALQDKRVDTGAAVRLVLGSHRRAEIEDVVAAIADRLVRAAVEKPSVSPAEPPATTLSSELPRRFWATAAVPVRFSTLAASV